MLKKVLIALLAILAALAVIIALQPPEFRIVALNVDRRARSDGVRAGQRFPQMGWLVALGKTRPEYEAVIRGSTRRSRRELLVVRQRSSRRRTNDVDGKPAE